MENRTVAKHWTEEDSLGGVRLYACLAERTRIILDEAKHLVVDKSESVLDIGCNCGRDLEALRRIGCTSLYGIEPCEIAVQRLKECYPKLNEMAIILNESVGSAIKKFADNQFHLAYTFTTLQHIPLESSAVFKDIAASTKYLMVVECEHHDAKPEYIWDRNYQLVFSQLGAKQLYDKIVETHKLLPGTYTLRVFDTRSVTRG